MVLVVIGFSTIMSGLQALHGSSRVFVGMLLTDRHLLDTLATECGILGLLFVFLHVRGWRAADFQIKPGWIASAQGLLLVPVMVLANSLTVLAGFVVLFLLQGSGGGFPSFIVDNSPHLVLHGIHVSWWSIVAALVFNAFFEEITTMGYTFNQLAAKRGPAFALVVVVLLRTSCHTYQGVVHALGIGAVFFATGLVYCWTRNLWPLILAHIIVDLLSVGAIKLLVE